MMITETGPSVEQTISVLFPISLANPSEVFVRIADQPDLSTDGMTVFRKGGTVVYDLRVYNRNVDWAAGIVEMRRPAEIKPTVARQIADHSLFVHLLAPNSVVAQQTTRQTKLAMEFLATLQPLMDALDAPVAVVRTANRVHTRENVGEFLDGIDHLDSTKTIEENYRIAEHLVNAYCKLHNSPREGLMFSAGMHALGYADVQVPYAIIPEESAPDFIEEFQKFAVIHDVSEAASPIEFSSSITRATYRMELSHCHRFDVRGESRYNPKGVWIVMRELTNT